MNAITFPNVSATNLARQPLNFPQDFPGRYTIAMLAFRRHQQEDVDTWLPFAQVMEKLFPEIGYIELPVVYKMTPLRQFMLNEGMRAGIPDRKARERTSTLYLDKAPFMDQLQLTTQDDIQVLLISDSGQVLWRGSGIFSSEKGKALTQKILSLTDPVTSDQVM